MSDLTSHYLREFRDEPIHVADLYPWERLVAEGILATEDDGLLTSFQLQAMDLGSLTEHEQGGIMLRLNEALKRLEGGWAIWMDAWHRPADADPPAIWPHPVAQLIDEAQRRQAQEQSRWTTSTTLSLWQRAPARAEGVLDWVLYTPDPDVTGETLTRRIAKFRTRVNQLVDLWQASSAALSPLNSEGILTYLHGLISDRYHPVRVPYPAVHLDYFLADLPLRGGTRPKLGDKFIEVLTLASFPEETQAGMLQQLNRLPFGFHWVSRWVTVERAAAKKEFASTQHNILSTRKGLRALLYEMFTKRESQVTNTYAEIQAEDTDDARVELSKDAVAFGNLTVAIVLMDSDAAKLGDQVRAVERILHGQGCIAKRERVNALEAWLGTLPGLPQANCRAYRMSTINFEHLSAWHQPWLGIDYVPHLKAAPLCTGVTESCMPFHFTNFVDDVGHCLVLGPSGSGKSALLALFAAYWLQYDKPQIFWFDIKRAARSLILSLDGHYYDLGAGTIAFQPFARIDEETERAWAYEWVLNRLREANVQINVIVQAYIETALGALSRRPVAERTLTTLLEMLMRQSRAVEGHTSPEHRARRDTSLTMHQQVREALRPFAAGGIHGWLLDAIRDGIQDGRVQCFELQLLLQTPRLITALMEYIFHRLYQRFDGSPSFFAMDEAWAYLHYPSIREEIDKGLRLLRDKNVSLFLASQNVVDVLDNDIGPMLLNNCPTRLLLPNPAATDPGIRVAYEALGLNATEIDIIARATPKQEVYISSPNGRRLVSFKLSSLAQAICGASRQEDHQQMDQILKDYGPKGFGTHWLKARGFDSWLPVDEEEPSVSPPVLHLIPADQDPSLAVADQALVTLHEAIYNGAKPRRKKVAQPGERRRGRG